MFQLVKISDERYEDIFVPVDNYHFENYDFVRVALIHAGGPWEMKNCRYTGPCVVLFQGAAKNAIDLLQMVQREGVVLGPLEGKKETN